MKLNELVELLKTNGVNSKGQVILALESASIEDLQELRIALVKKLERKKSVNSSK
jgi:hypothetical protein